MINNTSTRLNKYISESGICSRREADRYIEQGNVLINGKKAKIGDQVFAKDRVVVNGQAIEPQHAEELIFLALNKPVGVTSTTEVNVKDNIINYVNHSKRIFPIGRLDKDSQGLIFLTNNGDLVNKILRAGNKHEKEYLVTVNRPITDQFVEAMGKGVPILGEVTKRCAITKESPFVFKIVLIQGMNRQIRRMCEFFDYEVTRLERIRIMNVSLKGLPLGEWRELNEPELTSIFKLIEKSSSEKISTSNKSPKKLIGNIKEKPPRRSISTGKSYKPFKPKSEDRSFSKPRRSGSAKAKSMGPGKNKRSPRGRSNGTGKGRSSRR